MSSTLTQMLANDVALSLANRGAVTVVHNILGYADKLQRSNNEWVLADLRAYVKGSATLLERHGLGAKVVGWLHSAHEDYIPSAVHQLADVNEAEVGRLLSVISLALSTLYKG